jgi:putative peptidoglycan lipid II flippase
VIANLGIIIFGIALPKMFGMGIESQAWGALAGVLIGSLFIQLPAIRRSGLSIQPLWDCKDAGVRQVLRSLAPIIFGLSSGQIIALSLPRFFATALHPGDITALDNANRLMQVPLAVLASGPAIALYPTLSLLFAQNKTDEMREQLATATRRTLVLMLLATALLMALRFPVIHLLLEHGKFDKADTKFTSGVLFFYAAGLIGLGAQQMLARGFFAAGDARATVVIGVLASAIFAALAVLVARGDFGAEGLALAATIAISLLAVFMAVWLAKKLDGWDEGETPRTLIKAAIAAAITYFVTLQAQRWLGGALSTFDTMHTPGLIKLMARATVVIGGATLGTIIFALIAGVLGVRELGPLARLAPGKRNRGGSKYFRSTRF